MCQFDPRCPVRQHRKASACRYLNQGSDFLDFVKPPQPRRHSVAREPFSWRRAILGQSDWRTWILVLVALGIIARIYFTVMDMTL